MQGRVALTDPVGREGYFLNQRLEDRLGYAPAPAYALGVTPVVEQTGLGATSDGFTTRFQLVGEARYILSDPASAQVLAEGSVTNFTGYSATGSTVATRTAEWDARKRLMILLADQIVDKLVFAAGDFAR